ncbi:hypothetical protein ACFXC8_56910, partial [Streptomyces sp. NPDC059441]|uniref:hypothetical protein n=1 Tax=Streptomyces sp. NPDC059441 TaxID=3346829 RepID=UPI0036CAFA31
SGAATASWLVDKAHQAWLKIQPPQVQRQFEPVPEAVWAERARRRQLRTAVTEHPTAEAEAEALTEFLEDWRRDGLLQLVELPCGHAERGDCEAGCTVP